MPTKKLDYIISQGKMLVDMKDFLNALNPKHYKVNKIFPRLRTKISAQHEWNAQHRIKIKHHIIDCICNSGKVNIYKHGRTNIINYDQLEKEIINKLKLNRKYQ